MGRPAGGRSVVVRGDDLDPEDRASPGFLSRVPGLGRYGLANYLARDPTEIDDLAADQLERFPVLAVFRVGDLEGGGFEVVPTFRTPHVTIAFRGDLDERLRLLGSLMTEVRANPYHEAEPDRRSRGEDQ